MSEWHNVFEHNSILNMQHRIKNFKCAFWNINKLFTNMILKWQTPVRTRGFKLRNRSSVSTCASEMGRLLGKGWLRVGPWTGTLKNPKKCLAWEPDCRSNFFFSPPAHLLPVQDYNINSVHWRFLYVVSCINN